MTQDTHEATKVDDAPAAPESVKVNVALLIAAILCCLPLGLLATYFARRADSQFDEDPDAARRTAGKAKACAVIAIAIAILVLLG